MGIGIVEAVAVTATAGVGTPLRRGMIIMTGSMVPIQYPDAGDQVLVEISGLGTAELAVT